VSEHNNYVRRSQRIKAAITRMFIRVARGNEADNHQWHVVWSMSVEWEEDAVLLLMMLLWLRKLHSATRCCHGHEPSTRGATRKRLL